jgi:hypothetical protein
MGSFALFPTSTKLSYTLSYNHNHSHDELQVSIQQVTRVYC